VVLAQDAESRGQDSAIAGDRAQAFGDRLRHRGGQRGMIVNRGAVDRAFGGIVEMDADEEDARVEIGNGGARFQGDEDVGGAGHYDVKARGLELGPKAKGDVEGEVLFLEMVAGDAAVLAAVAGIDDDGVKGVGGIDDARGAAGEEENADGKQESHCLVIGHGKIGEFSLPGARRQ